VQGGRRGLTDSGSCDPRSNPAWAAR
jgi:hypothetical protein